MQMRLSSLVRRACQACGLLLVFAAVAGTAQAGGPLQSAPEIDPASAASALTLLVGGALMLRRRLK
jgi:uncharacterized protein (TIGR03382 family)